MPLGNSGFGDAVAQPFVPRDLALTSFSVHVSDLATGGNFLTHPLDWTQNGMELFEIQQAVFNITQAPALTVPAGL